MIDRMHMAVLIFLALLTANASASQPGVMISRADCGRLARHEPAPDVSYRPGIDVDGKPVTPADLGAETFLLPEDLIAEIPILFQNRSAVPAQGGLFQGEITVGFVAVAPDGRTWFNGQPLFDVEQDRLAAYCRTVSE